MRHLQNIANDVDARFDMHLEAFDGASISFQYRYISKRGKRTLMVHASASDGWEMIAVRGKSQVPSQSALKAVQRFLMEPDEWMMQLQAPAELGMDEGSTVIHLWRPIDGDLPLPPAWLVIEPRVREANRAVT